MLIVPHNGALCVEVPVRTTDIDQIRVDQNARCASPPSSEGPLPGIPVEIFIDTA
jgi:hypothetical protein